MTVFLYCHDGCSCQARTDDTRINRVSGSPKVRKKIDCGSFFALFGALPNLFPKYSLLVFHKNPLTTSKNGAIIKPQQRQYPSNG